MEDTAGDRLIPDESTEETTSVSSTSVYTDCFSYFKEIGISLSVGNILIAIALIVIQTLLYGISDTGVSSYFSRSVHFEHSGIGIIAGSISIIGAIITITSCLKVSYERLFATILTQAISVAVCIALVVFAITIPIFFMNFDWSAREFVLTECTCLDRDGNIERQGADDSWIGCQTKPFFTCADIDTGLENMYWKDKMLRAIVAAGCVQSLLALVSGIIAAWIFTSGSLKLINEADAPEAANGRSPEELFANNFLRGTISKIAYTQGGIALTTLLLIMTTNPGTVFVWDLVVFVAGLSYFVLYKIAKSENPLTHLRMLGIAALHGVSLVTIISVLIAMVVMRSARPELYVFLCLEIIVSTFTSFLPVRILSKLHLILEQSVAAQDQGDPSSAYI